MNTIKNKFIEIGLAKGYRLENPEDWYQGITGKELFENGLDYYRKQFNSLNNIIRSLFPTYNFLEWKFRAVQNNWWSDIENIKTYLIWLENELKWQYPDDWYKLSYKILEDNNGITIIKNHKYNITQIPKLLYPNYNYNEWKFKGYKVDWNNDFYVIKFLKAFESDIKILDHSDWYNISKRDIINNGGIGCTKNKEMIDIVKLLYPNYDWNVELFKKSAISKAQKFI